MPEVSGYPAGTPCWVDLATPDIEGASRFYQGLFGWEPFEVGAPEETGGYRVLHLRGRDIAGLGPLTAPGMPSMWTMYVAVDDADIITTAVTAAGGQLLVPPTDVLTVGRVAVFADATGAVFAVWQPGEHRGAGLVNEPGTLCWNELAARATERATRFYTEVFEWDAALDPTAEAPYTLFRLNGRVVAGHLPMDDSWPAEITDHWMNYFGVEDPDAAAARCVELGGSVTVEPMDIPPGRFAVCVDPFGANFSIIRLDDPDPAP